MAPSWHAEGEACHVLVALVSLSWTKSSINSDACSEGLCLVACPIYSLQHSAKDPDQSRGRAQRDGAASLTQHVMAHYGRFLTEE